MRRIAIPTIPNDIVNQLDTLESTIVWMKQLQAVARRLEEELKEIEAVLRFVIVPRFNKLNTQDMIDEKLKSKALEGGK